MKAVHVLARAFFLLLLLAGLPARADTTVSQSLSFRGQVNFSGTAGTLRTGNNSNPCAVTGSASATLSGIPTNATILSAQLYWAGSGNTPDYNINFDGQSYTATRQYTSKSVGNGFNFFSGAVDVTTRVKNKLNPNTSYTFSGLSVDNTNPWCASQAVLSGFALVVVYSHSNEPFRLLNLYEGFQYFQNNGFTIDLGNFNVPNPLPDNVTGRIGHITWEGDTTLSQGGENLLFNGRELVDTMNPAGNQFNSASSINNDANTWGVDFDAYTLAPPYIAAGQTTATTTYRSGQDLVLLSAEIVAMPFVGNADLALAMTRTGDLRVGSTAYYTLTVTNTGSDVETGPVTLVDTLPSGLKLVSTSGSGWTCNSSANSDGSTKVTCTASGPIEAGAKMTPLTLTVSPNAAGNYTNSATVSGRTGDGNLSNNTTSAAGTAIDPGSAYAIFTTEVCKNGDPIVTAPSDVGCHRFIGPVTAGAANTRIYVTATSGNKAMALDSSNSSTVTIDVAATCQPYSNVALGYAGQTLDCAGGWKSVTVTVPANSPTGTLPNKSIFSYADVGRISLSLRYQGYVVANATFISRPLDMRFQSVFRSGDSVADLMGTTADGWKKPSPTAFAKSGEQFTMRLGALMADGNFAPSFGKEPTALKGVLASELTELSFKLDMFAANPLASPVLPVSDADGTIDTAVKGAFVLDQGFTLNSAAAGAFDAKARWFEAGYLALTPYLSDYLGTGQVGGPPKDGTGAAQARIVDGTRVIGHFYPDHFETAMVAAFDCPVELNCPKPSTDAATPSFPPSGAIYSTQPFTFKVTPFALPRDGVPQPMSLFRNLAGSTANGNLVNGVAYRNVGLSGAVRPNDTTSAALAGFAVDAANPLPTSGGPASFPAMATGGAYTLGKIYSPDTANSGKSAPLLFYLRASMRERVVTGPSTVREIVVDSSTPAASPATQYEDGLMVLSGRLLVPNVFGSELLNLPLNLNAQYWNGKAWTVNAVDSRSTAAEKIVPVNCTRFFSATGSATPGTCKTAAIAPVSPGPVALNKGAGRLVLQSPGRGAIGSLEMTATGGNAAAWLPSTRGRATFGVYKSPVIYLREVY